MENFFKSVKKVSAILEILFVMADSCLADNESLIPTILFVILGGVFTLIYKMIEISEEN